MIVAIDGPAGAGKSSVARRLAERLGLALLDTGAMYRAVTLAALREHIEPGDGEALTALAARLVLDFDAEGRVSLDGEPAEPAIRGGEVERNVSEVSAHKGVRDQVVAQQRAVAERLGGLVAEGRDLTTVVFPDADHKFFLWASPRERARRRAEERGAPERIDDFQQEIERRDHRDMSREHSPLRQAEDAVRVDTDGLDLEQVVERLVALIGERRG